MQSRDDAMACAICGDWGLQGVLAAALEFLQQDVLQLAGCSTKDVEKAVLEKTGSTELTVLQKGAATATVSLIVSPTVSLTVPQIK